MLFTYVVYNTILLFVLIFGYFVKTSSTKLQEYACRTVVFLSIVLPASIREGIGTDYWNYVVLYKWYAIGGDEHEMGFQLLGKVMNYFNFDHQAFIAVLSILAFAPICYFLPKKKFYPFIVIYFLLLFLNSLNLVRQSISIALVTCGISVLYEEKGNLKYLLCVILAILFHYSSVLYLPLFLFKNIKFTKSGIYVCLGSILLIVSTTNIIEIIFSNSIFLNSRYGVYAFNSFNREASVGSGLGIMLNLILPFLFLILNHKISKYYTHVGFFTFLTMVFIFTYSLASEIHIFGRLLTCFMFVPAFLIQPVCKVLLPHNQRLSLFLLFTIYLVLYEKMIAVSQSSLGSGLGISPYTTLFD